MVGFCELDGNLAAALVRWRAAGGRCFITICRLAALSGLCHDLDGFQQPSHRSLNLRHLCMCTPSVSYLMYLVHLPGDTCLHKGFKRMVGDLSASQRMLSDVAKKGWCTMRFGSTAKVLC